RRDLHLDVPPETAGVPAEDPTTAQPELDSKPPAEGPVGLGHDLHLVHLVDGRAREQRVVRTAQERAPAREIPDGAAKPGLAALAAKIELRLALHRVRVRLDEVRTGVRRVEAPGRPAQPKRAQQPLLDVLAERL